ncbi:MAG: alpha/beta hydrolase [Candidatus Aminicenantales bacterium]
MNVHIIKGMLRLARLWHPMTSLGGERRAFERLARSRLFREPVLYTPVTADGVPGEWVFPEPGVAGTEGGAILYIHGGAFVSGSPATHRHLVWWLAREAERLALVVDYRLAPEHPYPAALEDVMIAYRWMIKQGFSPWRIAVVGDSAGGGLAVSMFLCLKERRWPLPGCAVLLCPWTDLSCSSPSFVENAGQDPMVRRDMALERARVYAGETPLHDPGVSPVYGDLSGLPPLLIQVGSGEALLDDSRRLAERARKAGVEVTLDVWPGMVHVWHYMPRLLPEAREALRQAGRFCREHTGG